MDRKRVLFIHQNFPGQFVHLSAALARRGDEVVALAITPRAVPDGVRCLKYGVPPIGQASTVPLARDLEVKLARASACASAMIRLRQHGFNPDVIVAHTGWGEAMFCKDIWPEARFLAFSEFYYRAEGSDVGFDPEFKTPLDSLSRMDLRMKNTALLHGLQGSDAAFTSTHWQREQVPPEYREKVRVVFDGIDTSKATPDPSAVFQLPDGSRSWRAGEEVLTFVNRNLEPYRGFHIFMRALPAILQARPNAHCIIVGGDDVSYGRTPTGFPHWRSAMLAEVGKRLPLDRVHFVGRLPYSNYLRLLQVSRCHAYLTYPFVLSWSLLEAMATGCNIVASNTRPVQEVMEDGVQGRLVDFFDVESLVQNIAAALEHPSKLNGMARAARDKVVDQYDITRVCLPKQIALVDALLGGAS